MDLDIRLDLVGQISKPGCENSVLMHMCFLNNMYFFSCSLIVHECKNVPYIILAGERELVVLV